jgi:outer membrane protein assembly factor BamB
MRSTAARRAIGLACPAVALAVTVLALAPPARAVDWPTPGFDAGHGRLSSELSGSAFTDGRWSYVPVGDAGALASPVVAEGYLVSAQLDGTVRGFQADSGAVIWQVAMGASVQGTPAIANGRVFIPTLGSKIVALALANGQQLWSTDLGGLNVSSPAIVNGDLIVGAGMPRQFVARLDGTTGAVVWQSPPGMEEFSNTAPAVGGGLVVVGTNGGHYYAFDVTTGLPRWDYVADGIVNIAAPLIAGGHVYLAGGQESDHVHAVDAGTGLPLAGWPITLPTPDPDVAGTPIYRRRAVSSFAWAGGVVVLQTRLDDALDTDGDGLPDQVLSRETVVGLDASSGGPVWQHPIARVVFTDLDSVPGFVVCPTPAAFWTTGGLSLLAVASSLGGTLSVLDAPTGTDEADLTTAGRALASPVMANGRLFTVAENGTVEARLSSVNHPPTAPMGVANPQTLDAADVTLRWSASMDLDGEQPTYELRIDSDGEVLQSYAQQLFPGQGATSMAITAPLTPGVTYTFAVRARDPHGALSGWSDPETFTVATAGTVTVNGTPATNLRTAIDGAMAGDVVSLGAGTFPISDTLHVAGGVAVRGAGAGRTIIDGAGLAVGLSFEGTDTKTQAGLDRATVAGAATCISVSGAATGVQLTHLVVRGCATAGIKVAAGGSAAIANATVTGDGTGVDSAGTTTTTIKNSLLFGDDVALESETPDALTSSYDDLFGNTTNYQGLAAGPGDLSAAVTFMDAAAHNYLLPGPQASTDQGDPADDVGAEPTPNGARINLGAFGGTADAELSLPAAVTGDPGSATGTPATPTPPGPTGPTGETTAGAEAGGCALSGGAPGSSGSLILVLVALALTVLRRPRRTSPRL